MLLLAIAGLPRSSYYYHSKRLQQTDKDQHVKEQITRLYHEHKGRVGYRRITLELHKSGLAVNHKKVYRLTKQLGLLCRVRMKKYRSYKGTVGTIAPNLLERQFKATRPNEKWVTDVTEFSLFGEKRYLSVILDLYSRDVVSYTIVEKPSLWMVTDMLDKALPRLPVGSETLIHSDQGWQYQHQAYRRLLPAGVRQSMSRKGNCLDNAVVENFFGILKSELLYLQDFDSMEHFQAELVAYLDYYNNRRVKENLKGLTPAQHRSQALSLS